MRLIYADKTTPTSKDVGHPSNSEVLLRYYPKINASCIDGLFVWASGLLISTSSNYRDFHISKYGENFYIPTFLKSLSILEKRIMQLFKAEAKES